MFSAGLLWLTGSVSVQADGYGSADGDLEGRGADLQAVFSPELWVAPNVALRPTIGYRYARVSTVELDGNRVYTFDGDPYSLDYSGLIARMGLTLR